MKEIFREIAGYKGLYEVSNLGIIRRIVGKGCNETRVLKPMKLKNGYLQVGLWKDGKKKYHYIHRLVAQAFIENPNNLPCVNHKDENKENNIVTNLEYCSYSYNNNYGTHNKRISEAHRGMKCPYVVETLSKKPVQLTLDYIFVKEWASTMECGRNGFNQGAVAACCRNEYCSQGNVYKGFRWMFAEDYYKKFVA